MRHPNDALALARRHDGIRQQLLLARHCDQLARVIPVRPEEVDHVAQLQLRRGHVMVAEVGYNGNLKRSKRWDHHV